MFGLVRRHVRGSVNLQRPAPLREPRRFLKVSAEAALKAESRAVSDSRTEHVIPLGTEKYVLLALALTLTLNPKPSPCHLNSKLATLSRVRVRVKCGNEVELDAYLDDLGLGFSFGDLGLRSSTMDRSSLFIKVSIRVDS